MSPWVATTWFSFTPTMTPQPVPQKRHGAFDHFISRAATPPGTDCAEAGAAMPAVAAAIAAACAFRRSRRVSSVVIDCLLHFQCLFENHVGGEHAVHPRNADESLPEHAGMRPLDHDDDLARARSVNL